MSIIAVSALFLFASCAPDTRPEENYENLDQIAYTESDEIIANPERGFYSVKTYRSASAAPITIDAVEMARFLKRTIFYTAYYLTDYMESDISEDFLNLIRTNMQILRENGMKCVLRFAYSDSEQEKPWDARPEIVQKHIQNIKPILQEYGDVIMVIQAGFVGVWGEWYYTENFNMKLVNKEDYALRKQVIDALLDAMPKDRSVALRTPTFKRMMYADSYADTLTIETAHNQSDLARLSCFNDCFGADANDRGTFNGNDSREYWKKDTRYVFMGGETCDKSAYCTCERTLADMKDYHWTYLNSEYNLAVIGRWRTDKCMDEIQQRLGYRLSLTDVYNDKVAVAGKDFRVVLKLKNSGFSAPINPRSVELVLVDGNGKKTVYEQKDLDPRYWFAGETVTIDRLVKIPADATGECKLYLNLPDPKVTLHDNPRFSIRLANENIWDEATGYNKVATFTL